MAPTLAEEFVLLALDDDKGTFALFVDYGVAGAILVDLVREGRVEIEDGRVVVRSSEATGDEVLDAALARIAEAKGNKPTSSWVQTFAFQGGHRKALVARLVAEGILREEEHRFLRIIPCSRYPEAQHGPEGETIAHLRGVLLGGNPIDLRAGALTALLDTCRILGRVLDREEMKVAHERIAEAKRADALGPSVCQALANITAALMAAVASTTSA